eukprot:2204-Heterococcus_DN1.PRE.2
MQKDRKESYFALHLLTSGRDVAVYDTATLQASPQRARHLVEELNALQDCNTCALIHCLRVAAIHADATRCTATKSCAMHDDEHKDVPAFDAR